MATQLGITFGNNADGRPVMQIQQATIADALPLMRALKKNFPAMWAQVNLEMIVPDGPAVNRILGVNGDASHP